MTAKKIECPHCKCVIYVASEDTVVGFDDSNGKVAIFRKFTESVIAPLAEGLVEMVASGDDYSDALDKALDSLYEQLGEKRPEYTVPF